MDAQHVVFQDEVQLLAWSETHNQGAKIVLQLADPAQLEVFKRMTVAKGKVAGQRLAAVFVEIGEDEQPVAQPAPAAVDRPKGGTLCRLAAQFCQQVHFRAWTGTTSAEEAAEWIRRTCQVASRVELDHDPEAASRFHEYVRKPYLQHLQSEGAPQ